MDNRERKSDSAWFNVVLVYLIIDLGRPQDITPLGAIRPGLLLFVVLLGFIATKGRMAPIRSPQLIIIIAMFLQLATYIPFARNNFYAYETAMGKLTQIPILVSIAMVVNSFDRLLKVVNLLIILMIYICGYSLFNAGRGPGSFYGDENDLCLAALAILPFAYYFLLQSKGWKFVFYGTALTVGLLSIVASHSRGGFVGLLAMFGVIWVFSSKKLVTLILAVAIGGTLLFVFADEEYRSEMATITDTEESTADARLNSWKAAWDMFCDYPLGVGGGNFAIRFPDYQGENFRRGMWGRAAHSIWFTVLPEMGITGISLYLGMIIITVKRLLLVRRRSAFNKKVPGMIFLNKMALALLASFAGYLSAGTFLTAFYYPFSWYMFIVAAVVYRLYRISAIKSSGGLRSLGPDGFTPGALNAGLHRGGRT